MTVAPEFFPVLSVSGISRAFSAMTLQAMAFLMRVLPSRFQGLPPLARDGCRDPLTKYVPIIMGYRIQ
jgi:hypothetical protein